MLTVGVSGTVTNDDQRAYIKIETLSGKTLTNFFKRWLLLTKPLSGISSLNWNLSAVNGEAKVPRDRKNSGGPSRTWNKWRFSRTI